MKLGDVLPDASAAPDLSAKPLKLGDVTEMAGVAPQDPAAASPTGPSRAERFGTGLLDPLVGASQLATHVLEAPERMISSALGLDYPDAASGRSDKYVQDREKRIQAERAAGGQTGTDWARMAGNVLSPVNYIPLGPVAEAGPAAQAAIRGAASGAAEPVTKDDFWTRKGWQTAVGGVAGAAASLPAKLIAPKLGGDAARLAEQGVNLTPGQMAGGIARRTEEIAKRFPILGSFIRGSEDRSVESFNKATINQALEPIAQKLPKDIAAGHDAVGYAQRVVSDAYEELLPKVKFKLDQELGDDIAKLRSMASELPPAQREQFNNIVQNRVTARLEPTGTMDGQTLKQVESELRVQADTYRTSADAAQRQLGQALNEVKSSIRDALMRQNPAHAKELADINAAYAMLARVEGAASRRASSSGVFTPNDLLQVVKQGDKSVRKKTFARGDALYQDWAEAAQRVLPNKVPDSGTAERLTYFDLLGGAGGWAVNPQVPLALGGASLPYPQVGGDLVRRYVTPGATRQAVGAAAEAASPYAAPAADAGATAILSQLGLKP